MTNSPRHPVWCRFNTAVVVSAILLLLLGAVIFTISRVSSTGAGHQAVLVDNVARARQLIRTQQQATAEVFFARSAAMADFLISQGANVNATDGWGCTPLHFASGLGATDVAEVLLRAGAHVDARNSSDERPLHWATLDIVNADTGFDDSGWSRTLQRKLDMARTLIRHGAEVNVRDGAGRTPLFDAVWAGPDLVQCLIAAGADVGATSTDRYTALHEAVRASGSSGDTEVVGLLLQHGANVLAKDWQGKIPRDYANRSNQKLITFLKTFEQSNRMGIQLTPVGK